MPDLPTTPDNVRLTGTPSKPPSIYAQSAAVILLAAFFLSVTMVWTSMQSDRDMLAGQSRFNLQSLGLALLSYHSRFGTFPTTKSESKDELQRSWRVDLLPYIESANMATLRDQYDERLPWNAPDNQLTRRRIDAFRSPFETASGPITNYVAVVGDGFIFNDDGPVRVSQIADSLEKTIILVEYVPSSISWAEPRDLTFDEYAAYFAANNHPYGGFLVLFADGTTAVLGPSISKEQLHALFTYNGKEAIEPEVL